MPTLVEKREVLKSRGQVILYGSGTSADSYFYKKRSPENGATKLDGPQEQKPSKMQSKKLYRPLSKCKRRDLLKASQTW